MKRKFSTSTKNEKEEKDRVGVAGEPEMPTKTYVCLKHGVQFEPLEKVVFNERLFFLLRFLPSTKSFPRCVHKWIESQKDARARFFD